MIVGTEWLIEATGCNPEALRDETVLRALFDRVITELGLKSVGDVWHKFEGEAGVTGLIALTESHLACHTYPEHGTATFNLYCCRTRPEWDWEKNLMEALGASQVNVTKIERGSQSSAAVPAAVLRASRPQHPADNKQANIERKFVSYGEVNIRERGRLPHWEKEDGIYFVTFRLADSLPQHVLDQLENERSHTEQVLASIGRELSHTEQKQLDWLFSEKVDEYLDQNYGACELRSPIAAKIVADSLQHFDGKRYHLYAWCVMPNHVHVVFRPIQRFKLDEVLHSWKSFSSHEINKALGRTGEFWQREYYDHLVRNESQLDVMIRYTLNNPAKAGLRNWEWIGGLEKYNLAETV
jgi:S-adenosylmethionine decarboxylase proenzyme